MFTVCVVMVTSLASTSGGIKHIYPRIGVARVTLSELHPSYGSSTVHAYWVGTDLVRYDIVCYLKIHEA